MVNKTIKDGDIAPDPSGTTCLPGHMERFEQREKKRTQEKDCAQAVCMQNVFFFNALSIFDRLGILDHLGHFLPFQTIMDHS